MTRSHQWETVSYAKGPVHVLPVKDLKRHHTSAKCWCKPVIQKHAGSRPVIIHNSMDGRELIEQHGIN